MRISSLVYMAKMQILMQIHKHRLYNMLAKTEDIPPYERQLLLIARQAFMNSPMIDDEQKRRIDKLFQDIVDIFTEKR